MESDRVALVRVSCVLHASLYHFLLARKSAAVGLVCALHAPKLCRPIFVKIMFTVMYDTRGGQPIRWGGPAPLRHKKARNDTRCV